MHRNKKVLGLIQVLLILVAGILLAGCGPSPVVEEICQPGADFSLSEVFYHVGFERYPNGDPVVFNSVGASGVGQVAHVGLSGDEFEDCGIKIGTSKAAPGQPFSDLNQDCVVIYQEGLYEADNPLLAVEDGCTSRQLHVIFTDPVAEVSLRFIGAEVNYTLFAYDLEGNQIGFTQKMGDFVPETSPNPVMISYRSDQANISSIGFSGTGVVFIAVDEFIFNR